MHVYKNKFLVLLTILYFSLINGMQFSDLPREIVQHICTCFTFNTTNIPEIRPFQFNELPKDVGDLYDQYYNPLKYLCKTLINFSLVNTKLNNILKQYFEQHKILAFHHTKDVDLFCFPYKSNNEIYYLIGKLSFCPTKFCFSEKQYFNNSSNRRFQLEQFKWLNKQCNYGILIFILKEDTCVNTRTMLEKIGQNSAGTKILWQQCIDYACTEACKKKIKMWKSVLKHYIPIRCTSHMTTNILPDRNVYTLEKYLLLSERFDYEAFDTLMKLK